MSITTIYKNDSWEVDLAGMTIRDALIMLKQIFNISLGVIPHVNNSDVNIEYILKDGDVLRLFNSYPMH